MHIWIYMFKLKTILVLLFLFLIGNLLSMNFKRLSIEDGLSNSIVYSIAQDKEGLIWLATKTGVDSYNGSQFNHFNLSVDSSALPSQGRQVLYDTDENLWVGTTDGLFKYRPELGKFQIASRKFQELQNFRIFKLSEDNQKRIWIGTINSLYVYMPEKDSIRRIQEIALTVNDIQISDNNFCFVATTRGVYKINTTDYSFGQISSVKSINDTFSNEFISSLYIDSDNRIWIGVLNKGLFIYDPQNEKLIHVSSIQKYLESGIIIKDIKLINGSEYLIATDGNGLLSINSDLSFNSHFVHEEDNPESLSINDVYTIYIDAEKRVWISTYGGGLSLYDPHLLPFSRIDHITNNSNSIANNTGRVVIEDQYKRLWFGTKKGISIYFPSENRWKHIFNTLENPYILGQNGIMTCCQVTPDEIWFGSFGGGIDRVNINTFEVTPVFPRDKIAAILGSSYIYSICKDTDGNIWFSLLRSQLVRYNPQTKEVTKYPIANIQQIREAASGELIIASRNGLFILNKESGVFKQFYHQQNDTTSIRSSEVCTTFEDDNGKIYIGTENGGLNIFDPVSEEFTHYMKEDGLPSNSVCGIVNDSKGMIWLSTSNGISMFNPVDKSFVNYDSSDGQPVQEFNNGVSYKTSNGMIIFGGTKGFVSFYPDQIKKISIPPKLIFTDLKISNLSVNVDPDNGPLFQNINLTKNLNLKYNQNSFSFYFFGINYTNPIKNQYSWKLEGFDREWSPRSNEKTATYTNIPPGNYTFKVRSTNIKNGWNGNERNIEIQVYPPFYMSNWALIIYFVLLVTSALLIFNYQRIRYEEKHGREKIQFFINLAHDLRTPLTLIQSPLSKILENKTLGDTDKKYLDLAQRNAGKLTQLFNQLLDFQKADLRKMQLQVDQHEIIEHIKSVIQIFQPLIDKKSIVCDFKANTEKLLVRYDAQKLDKVFYNLISNAIKYSKEKGYINISVGADKMYCFIEIKDTGIGIPPEQQKDLFKRYFRATNAINSAETGSGVGLILVKQLIDLHKGKISFESNLNEGTCIKIKIPLKGNHFHTSDFLNKTEKSEVSISKLAPISVSEIGVEPESDMLNSGDDNSKKPKVVIVEDNEELRTFLINSLQPNYRVIGSENGKVALSVIEKVHPDVIISDIMMPEMDGTTLCIHLKSHIETCHIPIILLTALTDTDSKIGGYEVGADAYLEKPFDIHVLRSRIENLLHSRVLLKDKFLKYNEPTEKIDFKSKIDQEFIQKAVQIVNDNMSDSEFSVEILCKLIYMSRPVLYRKLKALLDQSPQDFIKIIRLKKAVEYMHQSDMNITEIAYQTGFSDPKYFATCFKNHYGMSPSLYSKQL